MKTRAAVAHRAGAPLTIETDSGAIRLSPGETAHIPAGVKRLRHAHVAIDLEHRRVVRGEEEIHLSPKEYGVLAELAARPDRVISHGQLLRAVWGPAQADRVDYLRIVVRNIRQKLEADPARPRLIINEPGVGYRLGRG